MNVTRIGLDLAKNVFQVHGVDRNERVLVRRCLSRAQVEVFFGNLPPCLIGMEACGSAHHWARLLQRQGHTVRLMAPQFVKPYIKNQKNDANDAEGICEAVGRPNMRFVAIKSVEQQDMQALHRIRSERIRQRTATANQIRGLLGEYGIVIAKGINQLRRALPRIIEERDNMLSVALRQLVEDARQDLARLDSRIKELDSHIERIAREDEASRRLQTIPGIGPITATALVADLGDARQFRRSRELPAFLGIVPRQHSSGGKERLLGISKQGDRYLRTLLIHGARSVLRTARKKGDPRSRWVIGVGDRRHENIAAVALANKNARIAWALLSRGGVYDSEHGYRIATTQPL